MQPPKPNPSVNQPQLERLIAVVDCLRGPGGCPWDQKQTEASMAPHLLEETYEALEAIESGRADATTEELGDVLMNVLMISRIASETGRFDLESVAASISDKLVRRHPHVFGDAKAKDADEVLTNWEQIKLQEKGDGDAEPRSVLAGVPANLPSLLRAYRMGEKAARVGFDWPDRAGPRDKVTEELAELDQAIAGESTERVAEELGDLLFSVVNLARHLGHNPEMALRQAADRFAGRFRRVESSLGERLSEASLSEMEAAWNKAKGS